VVAASAVITRCRDMERAKQRLQSMQLVAGYFDLFSLRRYIEHARSQSERHQHVLQYAGSVATAEGFESAAMNLCNELATRSGASRVSLGWLKGKQIKVKALSHTEKFDKKQELVIELQKVMEECLDQEEPVRFDPEGNSSQNVTRNAREHSLKQGGIIVMSVPLRRRDEIVGVLTLEFPARSVGVDGAAETGLAVAAELLAPQLFDRYENDRNIFVKVGHSIRNVTRMAIGPKYMGIKLLIFAVLALGVFVSLYTPVYRVRSSFLLQPVEKRSICAPFKGSLDQVFFKPGDAVKKGDVLARMRTTEMQLEKLEAEEKANTARIQADAASRQQKFADMRGYEAQRAQAQAHVDLLSSRIAQADLVAPFDGVLMKGDLYDKQGAPAEFGDVLFEIARSQEGKPTRIAVEAEIQISERDIQEVVKHAYKSDRPFDGQISTTSFPDQDHKFKITRIVPLGVPKEGENVFQVYASIENDQAPEWMHPGLAGEARVDIEKRRMVWIWTHKLTDWLRLKLWI
jgi:multidrug efflux pump subunit AcrA (membrane-fusion protein)